MVGANLTIPSVMRFLDIQENSVKFIAYLSLSNPYKSDKGFRFILGS